MANEENLKPQSERTKSEQREIAAKGGIASGKSRRRKKAMKERLQEALECSVVNPKVKKMMQSVGMEDGRTNYDAVTASIVAGAIQGAPGYARLLMELIGETGEEKRADKADKRDAKRLRMQEEEFKQKHEGVTEDNDMVLQFIEGMKQKDDLPDAKTD
ncbi:MAG: hypothetical protein LKG56_03525 [Lachnospiraceae bacterium]|jgi:hypothetical protein|nr:hypothetical protein [Lachnospiraceae bacterium]MCH4030540.1 hypothetical protein [Lachnospiraceae bacterium]MCH4069750.1 hypothetical protein [Lachnospiraceae bacterium]MCH4107312.1 hypothetical protein [Lachnospiraceae bacterium]MCI1301834.1 hypothetical protein [Lachnospiraceae bacterium]